MRAPRPRLVESQIDRFQADPASLRNATILTVTVTVVVVLVGSVVIWLFGGNDYPDLTPDGRIGPATLAALDTFLTTRGRNNGNAVLLRALEALQGERYLRLAERRPGNYILDKATTRVASPAWL